MAELFRLAGSLRSPIKMHLRAKTFGRRHVRVLGARLYDAAGLVPVSAGRLAAEIIISPL